MHAHWGCSSCEVEALAGGPKNEVGNSHWYFLIYYDFVFRINFCGTSSSSLGNHYNDFNVT